MLVSMKATLLPGDIASVLLKFVLQLLFGHFEFLNPHMDERGHPFGRNN